MLADIIRSSRLAAGYTQERLAGAVGVSKRTITRIEGGSPVLAETLLAICSVLRLDYAQLDRVRRSEAEAEVSPPPVLAADNPSVARHHLPDALASLRDQPGIAFVALPDLASWRASQNPPRGTDLDRSAFRGAGRRAGLLWGLALLVMLPLLVLVPATLAYPVLSHGFGRAVVVALLIMAAMCAVQAWLFLLLDKRFRRNSLLERSEAALERVVYAFSERCVHLVVAEDDRVSVIRHDLASKRDVVRTDLGASVSYAFRTDRGAVTIEAVPHDPRIEAILMRTSHEDPVRRFERPLAAAA